MSFTVCLSNFPISLFIILQWHTENNVRITGITLLRLFKNKKNKNWKVLKNL